MVKQSLTILKVIEKQHNLGPMNLNVHVQLVISPQLWRDVIVIVVQLCIVVM